MRTQEKCLIAVASKDGRVINQHFGHAERFLIYEASFEKIEFMKQRQVNRYCLGSDTYEHPFEEDRFMEVANTIKDCRFVLISKIGSTPEMRLKRMGIIPLMMCDHIESGILRALGMEVSE